MSPSAEPANLAAEGTAATVTRLLEDGEIVLLAVKPSRWFVLLVSWPVLLLAGAVMGVTWIAGRYCSATVDEPTVTLLCSVVAFVRVMLAGFQWLGRLYLLTNRRVMRLRGIIREDVFQCPLKRIRQTCVSATLPERWVAVSSLLFEFDPPRSEGHWTYLASAKEVRQAVEEAREHAR